LLGAGLWWGYNIGIFVQNVCLLAFVARLNWQTEANNVSMIHTCISNITVSKEKDIRTVFVKVQYVSNCI